MAEYVTFEGTTDYIVHYPAMITTFTAGNAIDAGDFVVLGRNGQVSGSGVGVSGSPSIQGVAIRTAASGDKVPVVTWGYIKNVTAGNIVDEGDFVEVVGKNFVGSLGANPTWGAGFGKLIGRAVTAAASGSKVRILLRTW